MPEEGGAAEHDRPQVVVDQGWPRRRSTRIPGRRRRRSRTSSRGRPGPAAPRRGRTRACRPAAAERPGRRDRRRLPSRRGAAADGAASVAAARRRDRRVLVDVLHRHRGQVVALADAGAELGHDHRVGAQVVEEVAVDRAPARPAGRSASTSANALAGRRLGRRRERGGQAADRRVLVDVLHRHRRQVVALADAGAELGHDHRVGAQVVEEVAVDRHPVDRAGPRPARRRTASLVRARPGRPAGTSTAPATQPSTVPQRRLRAAPPSRDERAVDRGARARHRLRITGAGSSTSVPEDRLQPGRSGRRCRGTARRGPGRWPPRSVPSCRVRASQPIAPLTTVPVEPPKRKPRRASRWQARMVSGSSTRTTSSMKDSSSSGGRTLVPRPGIIRRAGGPPKVTEPTASTATIRTGRCHVAEVARAAHQGPRGARADEQHVESGKCGRSRGAVVRLCARQFAGIRVLVEPHVPVVGGAQPLARSRSAHRGSRRPRSGSVTMCTWLPSASMSRRVDRLHRGSVTQRNR